MLGNYLSELDINHAVKTCFSLFAPFTFFFKIQLFWRQALNYSWTDPEINCEYTTWNSNVFIEIKQGQELLPAISRSLFLLCPAILLGILTDLQTSSLKIGFSADHAMD